MSRPGLAKSNRAPRTKNGNDSAQTNKTNDARTKQWPVRPGWWVEWVTRGSRGSEAGRDYDYDHVNGAWRRKKGKLKRRGMMAEANVEIAVCVRLACLLHQSIPWLVQRGASSCSRSRLS